MHGCWSMNIYAASSPCSLSSTFLWLLLPSAVSCNSAASYLMIITFDLNWPNRLRSFTVISHLVFSTDSPPISLQGLKTFFIPISSCCSLLATFGWPLLPYLLIRLAVALMIESSISSHNGRFSFSSFLFLFFFFFLFFSFLVINLSLIWHNLSSLRSLQPPDDPQFTHARPILIDSLIALADVSSLRTFSELDQVRS